MKTINILLLLMIALSGCTKSDDFEGNIEVFAKPNLEGDTRDKTKIRQMYETYNVLFKPEFSLEEYTWDWNVMVAQTATNVPGLRYSPAKPAYVAPVIDAVDEWVFKVFPTEFSRKNMPLNILLVDTLGNKFQATPMLYRMYEGNIATNYIILSYVSERFDEQKNKRLLRESWLSLFVEKMLSNWPSPTAFGQVSSTAYAKLSFTNAEDATTNYALLKKGRAKQTNALATGAWSRVTVGQDFGDYVAFIVFTPDSEKAVAYAKNPNVLIKVNLVKAYFKDNFNIELPYRPISN